MFLYCCVYKLSKVVKIIYTIIFGNICFIEYVFFKSKSTNMLQGVYELIKILFRFLNSSSKIIKQI